MKHNQLTWLNNYIMMKQTDGWNTEVDKINYIFRELAAEVCKPMQYGSE